MKREPALLIGLVTAAVTSVLALLVAFGFTLTPGEQGAILGVIAGVGPLLAAVFTRANVFAPANVAVQAVGAGTFAGPASNIPTGAPVVVTAVPDPAVPLT